MQVWKENGLKITIKNVDEIKSMRRGGKILGIILKELGTMCIPGQTGKKLDAHAEKMMRDFNVLPSFKGYRGFPNVCCININDEVVHGIPSEKPFKEGDIVTIDCGVVLDGFHTDSAITVGVGKISDEAQRFIAACEKALEKGIEVARAGIRVREISKAVQTVIEKNGYGVVRELIGHGIGTKLHEDPQVPNYVEENPGPILQEGMTLAIEPIITMGDFAVKLGKDGWTYLTADGSLAAQVEHTILITKKGSEILTKR